MTPDIHTTFKALGDPTRCRIVSMLSRNAMTIGEVADHFDMTRAAVKKHLTVLEAGCIISVQTSGRERINRLNPDGLRSAADWIAHFSHFWDDKLAALKTAIEQEGQDDDRD